MVFEYGVVLGPGLFEYDSPEGEIPGDFCEDVVGSYPEEDEVHVVVDL